MAIRTGRDRRRNARAHRMTGDHRDRISQHDSKNVPRFAPNFTVYVLPSKVVCLYSEDRKFFLHGELYCERAIELAVKKELAVLGIEAHDLGRQHIDGEIRREPRNILAVMLRNAIAVIACHAVSTRVSTPIATSPDRHCKTRILELARAPPSRSGAGVSR